MNTNTVRKQTILLENLVEELETIKNQLKKLLLLIPEESLKEYKNPSKIKRAYLNAVRSFSPN